MSKERQDAWSHEDDLLLAETVLRHIREGSTQLRAFEEVGDKLNRTSAACGFRWNAEVRQSYDQAVQIAKKQRKEKKRALANNRNMSPIVTPAYESKHEPSVSEEMASLFDWSTATQEKYSFPIQKTEKDTINLDKIIDYLRDLKEEREETYHSRLNHEKVIQENQLLSKELENTTKKVNGLENELATMKDDYQAFMQIVERARKMVVFEEEESRPVPKFRMDKNGNLEQVAK